MQQQIIDSIYYICTERGGIYSSLFGTENTNIKLQYQFNFSFENSQHLTKDIQYFLDNIIAKIINENNFDKLLSIDNCIEYNDQTHNNIFLSSAYRINNNIKLCDIENYLDDIECIVDNNIVNIKWTLPIYEF